MTRETGLTLSNKKRQKRTALLVLYAQTHKHEMAQKNTQS